MLLKGGADLKITDKVYYSNYWKFGYIIPMYLIYFVIDLQILRYYDVFMLILSVIIKDGSH